MRRAHYPILLYFTKKIECGLWCGLCVDCMWTVVDCCLSTGILTVWFEERRILDSPGRCYEDIVFLYDSIAFWYYNEGTKSETLFRCPEITKTNRWQFQNAVPDHSIINARLSAEVNPRPDFFSITEYDSRRKKVGRENCKLEKQLSGASQGSTQNFRDTPLWALTVPGYCPCPVRMNTLFSQDVSANKCVWIALTVSDLW